MQFSDDTKTIAVIVRNGEEESIVRMYDYFIMKKARYVASSTYHKQIIHNV